MFNQKVIIAALALAAFTLSHSAMACEPAVYSLSNKQLTFPSLAVEMYMPYTDIPDGTYTLCTGKGGPIVMSYQSLGDFAFAYKRVSNPNEPPQEVECVQQIPAQENCYPTYSGKDGRLHFPTVRVPWIAILPLGNKVEAGGSCYEALLDQGNLRPGVFTVIQVAEKHCE